MRHGEPAVAPLHLSRQLHRLRQSHVLASDDGVIHNAPQRVDMQDLTVLLQFIFLAAGVE